MASNKLWCQHTVEYSTYAKKIKKSYICQHGVKLLKNEYYRPIGVTWSNFGMKKVVSNCVWETDEER